MISQEEVKGMTKLEDRQSVAVCNYKVPRRGEG